MLLFTHEDTLTCFLAICDQVLETADLLSEVTESVDYYVQGKTLAGGNLFGRGGMFPWVSQLLQQLPGSYLSGPVYHF